jgi:short-subunit dehydrogenase
MTSNVSPRGKALITGASSGIGAVYADRLARRGYDLILVARREDRLRALAATLEDETGRTVEIVAADLGDRADRARVEQVLREDPAISVLVNNAGIASVAPLVAADPDEMEAMIDLNVTVLTRLTYAAAPAFVARGQGTIINIASVAAIGTERLNGVYSASKAYVLAFGHSLQNELADKGIRIQTVLPAATATDLWENAGLHYSNLPAEVVMSTGDMVDAALAGLDLGELVTIPPLQDGSDWDRFEAGRQTLLAGFGHSRPAPRYGVPARAPVPETV